MFLSHRPHKECYSPCWRRLLSSSSRSLTPLAIGAPASADLLGLALAFWPAPLQQAANCCLQQAQVLLLLLLLLPPPSDFASLLRCAANLLAFITLIMVALSVSGCDGWRLSPSDEGWPFASSLGRLA